MDGPAFAHPMLVEVWSDVVCPWCYVGRRRLTAALEQFEHRDSVEVVWRSFELDPRALPERTLQYVPHLATKYRVSEDEARAMIDRMVRTGAGVGLHLDFEAARPGNTFDAHRLLHLAGERGVQDALKERLFAATFTEGRPIGLRDTLVELAGEVGLDEAEAGRVLDSDGYAVAVRADEEEAARLGITGVPFFAVGRRIGVAGAQQPDVLLDALRQAWVGMSSVRTGSDD